MNSYKDQITHKVFDSHVAILDKQVAFDLMVPVQNRVFFPPYNIIMPFRAVAYSAALTKYYPEKQVIG